MSRSSFIEVLRSPEKVVEVEESVWKEIHSKYPWYSVPHVMRAYASNLAKKNDYPELLSSASAYSTDRTRLFNIIEHNAIESVRLLKADDQAIEATAQTEVKDQTNHKEPEVEEKPGKEPEKSIDDAPVFEYIPYEQELQKAIKELEKQGDAADVPAMPREGSKLELEIETALPHSFVDWMYLLAGEKVTLVDASAARRPIKVNRQGNSYPKNKNEPHDFTEADAKLLARKSLELPDELISETYASILVEQGKIEKAIDVYKRLGLKYPDKLSYFAGLIVDLNKQ
jgi:hypothetical protein